MNPSTVASSWRQLNIAFQDWTSAEDAAVTHVAPLLRAAEADGLITSWFFVRKAPCWRLRYLPGADPARATAQIHGGLSGLRGSDRIEDVREVVYEPETRAFGGAEGMAAAHRLFHQDSRRLLDYLAESPRRLRTAHRRELSILLCSNLLRAAGLDWYEQGDVWARVAEHREPPGDAPVGKLRAFEADLRRLMSVDTDQLVPDAVPTGFVIEWAEAFAATGRTLADLATGGLLHRGLRAILAHHIIFTWNRHGVNYTAQAALAHTAASVVLGNDPTAGHTADRPDETS